MGKKKKNIQTETVIEETKVSFGKIKIKEFTKYIDDSNLSVINKGMIKILLKMLDEYITNISINGVLIKEISREGKLRVKKNPLCDSVTPLIAQIGRLLKDNNLTLPKDKEGNEIDPFTEIIDKLLNTDE